MRSMATAVAQDLCPTGALRASINLGNPVLAQGTPEGPTGVTVDLARELGARLGIPVELVCFDAARKSFEAMTAGHADIGFLAIEPAREAEVAFTAPYVVIEGVYVVPPESPITTAAEVDRDGVRIGVKQGSAYDLFLSRTVRARDRGARRRGARRLPGSRARGRSRHPPARGGVRGRRSRVPPDRGRASCRSDRRSVRPRGRGVRRPSRTSRAFVEQMKANGFVADASAARGPGGCDRGPGSGLEVGLARPPSRTHSDRGPRSRGSSAHGPAGPSFPVQVGGRFSRKAPIPSCASPACAFAAITRRVSS